MKGFFGRKMARLGMAAAVIGVGGVGAGHVQGMITLQETVEPIDGALSAAGWIGIKLTLVADATSRKVSGVELKHNIALNGVPRGSYLNGTPFDAASQAGTTFFPDGTTIGISGPVHQAWNVTGGAAQETAVGDLDGSGGATDSSFLTGAYLAVPDAFTEDNNLLSGVSGGFEGSPLGDADGAAYGVGSLMTYVGVISQQEQLASMDIAFLIVPADGDDVRFTGVALDRLGNNYGFDVVLNPAGFDGGSFGALQPAVVPEAGTVGVLGVGMGMVMRRRRKA